MHALLEKLQNTRAWRLMLWAGLPALLLFLVCMEGGPLTVNMERITSEVKLRRSISKATDDAKTTSSLSSFAATSTTKKALNNPHQQSSLYPVPRKESVDGALEFLLERRQAYQDHSDPLVPQRWKMRGNGILATRFNIVLTAEGTTWNETNPIQPGRNVVSIWNVHPKASHNFRQCHLLSIWVRVAGVEIFAGSAQAVPAVDDNTPCHWEFPFDLQAPGDYHIDARILLWNGASPVHLYNHSTVNRRNQCPQTTTSNASVLAQEHYPTKTGFLGFKFYSPVMSCCEICRRTEGCQYWQTPPEAMGNEASMPRNGCDLYYDAFTTPLSDIPKSFMLKNATKTTHVRKVTERQRRTRRLIHEDDDMELSTMHSARGNRRLASSMPNASGTPFSEGVEPAIFVGCGWSFEFSLDFPCLDGNLDDMVFMANPDFEFTNNTNSLSAASQQETESITRQQRQDLDLCRAKDESVENGGNGRWIREPWPDDDGTCPPRKIDANHSNMFDITEFDGNFPHCWHRDDLSKTSNRCVETNCRLIPRTAQWKSSLLFSEQKWMGVWRNDQCNYLEFTNEQLQQCITQRKISKITAVGASIASNIRVYLGARLNGVELYKPDDGKNETTLDITLHSLKWPHMCWRETEEEWRKKFNAMQPVPSNEEQYWLSSFYVTSEREPYVHLTRAEQLMTLAEGILTPKGYQMINTFNLSAAFSYDTAGQNDGMHIIGPPMKMAMTKIFHHMCADVVEGSPL